MNEVRDKELSTVRLRILDLIKSFFMDEPDEDKISIWKEVISTLTSESINPEMDKAVKELDKMLSEMPLDDLKDEYYELFTNPFSTNKVNTTLSYYENGHDFGQSLVDLRRFLINADITKSEGEGLDESEDSLVFLLDTLITLINDEEQEHENARKKQAELLTLFLEPFSVHFNSALQQNEKAKFFEACAAFLIGYVDLEKGLLV